MGHNTRMKPTCHVCGDHYSPKRKAAGYKTCLWCGEEEALQQRKTWCVAQQYSKGGYQLITNTLDLKNTNQKNASLSGYTESINTLGDAPW
jgi:hypothetical protein